MLKGMTWDHARGYEPLAAASAAWIARGGSSIAWERRSLQDFETYPVDALARTYDLIVIDHPHVGIAADAGCLLPIGGDLAAIAAGSVGRSYDSYRWADRQWALPIDAAAQVQAWVPGRIDAPAHDWTGVMRHAAAGRVALPLRPPHSLMSLMTLCRLCGIALDATGGGGGGLFPDTAAMAYDALLALTGHAGVDAFDQDPITVLEAMAHPDSPIALAPLIYGYVSYAQDGFRAQPIAFADLPVLGAAGPAGSVLGGTGIAVSAFTAYADEALAFARWLASGSVQRDIVARHGGQPAHDAAWRDDRANAAARDFYRETRRTLEAAWVRPRGRGYMAVQHEASTMLNAALAARHDARDVLQRINAIFLRHCG